VKIDRVGKHIDKVFAHKYYSEFSLGIDFTARDIQEHCKANGLPWEKAKGFDSSAVLSNKWINKNEVDLTTAEFTFYQNDVLKQTGHPRDFIFSIDEIISYVSQFMTLKTGDLIYTGTPAGVGPVHIGDQLRGELNGEPFFALSVK
jgi:2-keto-4-pentenoate hydratase/2-oxohepta-3-ene-1,7-dioic acid hydratase in catechol pathway